MSSLAVKYRPKDFKDVTEQSVVTDILDSICEDSSEDMACRNFLLIGPAGCGKAQPLTSEVLTPDGYISMEKVEVGTEVITDSGAVAEVSEIYPQGELDTYRIHLVNGDYIDVSDEHINIVYITDDETREYTKYNIETKDLLDVTEIERYSIPTSPIDLSIEELPTDIDPFILGVLFAQRNLNLITDGSDGYLTIYTKNHVLKGLVARFISAEEFKEIDSGYDSAKDMYYCAYKVDWGWMYELAKVFPFMDGEVVTSGHFHMFRDHILYCIQHSSIDIRHQFLEGVLACFDAKRDLMGCIEFRCPYDEYFDVQGFKFLIQSLGYVAEYDVRLQKFTIYVTSSYHHSSNMYSYFNEFYTHYLAPKSMRYIKDIEYLGVQECQCLMIDHDDHSYISNNLIPTHNTTCARIMANKLNEGVGQPIEIDAASHGNIDAMRELVKQAQQYPIGQNYKIFIVDEAHSISNQSWQVALKVLEEAPAKTIWIFCTTNPEKIPNTILSRVQTFQLSKISLKGIYDRLIYVIESEKSEGREITYTEDAVNYIAKMANGGMRDSLTLLDKALAFSEDLTTENLSKALNLPEYDDYFALLSSYAKKDNVAITKLIDKVYNSGVNFVKWFESFHSFVINIVKFIFLKDINMTMIPSTYQDKISKYDVKHLVICLKLANKLLDLNQELKTTQYLQEVALTYLCSVSKNS